MHHCKMQASFAVELKPVLDTDDTTPDSFPELPSILGPANCGSVEHPIHVLQLQSLAAAAAANKGPILLQEPTQRQSYGLAVISASSENAPCRCAIRIYELDR